MSLFDDDNYQWRETCFVFLKRAQRPTAKRVEETLRETNHHFQLQNVAANEDGLFESCTLIAPDAYAAIELSYVEGPEVTEQLAALPGEIRQMTEDPEELKKADRLPEMTARIDVMHFERLTFSFGEEEEEPAEGMFDPGALILVLEQLAYVCDGVPVDPQSGAIM